MQTPQVFSYALLKKAYDEANDDEASPTDDASLVEATGTRIHCVPGAINNMKITYPEDFLWATHLARSFGNDENTSRPAGGATV